MAGLKRKPSSSPQIRRSKRIKLDTTVHPTAPTTRKTKLRNTKQTTEKVISKPKTNKQLKTSKYDSESFKDARVIVEHLDQTISVIISMKGETDHQPEIVENSLPPIQEKDPKNELKRAIDRLSPSSAPLQLVGREEEMKQLAEFLEQGIQSRGSAHSLYMCGMPGTGKTATFLYTVTQLQKRWDFEFLHVNCMKLGNPNELYTILGVSLLGKKLKPDVAKSQLSKHFSKLSDKVWILLVDELDALMNRKQDVLYNLFDWAIQPKSGLIITGIANTMDLTERFIRKVSSRMGQTRIIYESYKNNQLLQILNSRIGDIKSISEDAIKFCCAKVASYSGDARRVFQVCRRAVQLCLSQNENQVTMTHIMSAYRQLFTSPFTLAISSLSKYLKLFLISMCLELRNNQSENTLTSKLALRMSAMLFTAFGEAPISEKESEEMGHRLSSLGLIEKENSSIRLKVSVDEIVHALTDDPLFHKYSQLF